MVKLPKIQPLIDGDIFLYEIGFGSETGWKAIHPDSESPPDFNYVAKMLDERINEIKNRLSDIAEEVAPPVIFLTGKGNFRIDVAKKKEYKGQRKESKKPYHYANIKAHLQVEYNAIIVNGMEADDALAIAQTNGYYDFLSFDCPTIICTRDKDLRQIPGWHFGWELGKQPQFGPKYLDKHGSIRYIEKGKAKELKGTGDMFFFAQMLMGDGTDNIPGLPQIGPKTAYTLLKDLQTYEELEETVSEQYRAFYGDSWKEEMLEQAMLVWMVREIDEEGKPIMWKLGDV